LNNIKRGVFLAPILIAMLESFIPALPLVLIVAFNISTYGWFWGFIYSYVGSLSGSIIVFLFFRWMSGRKLTSKFIRIKRVEKVFNWVGKQTILMIIVLSMLPTTPSSFMNLAFGLSNYPKRRYIVSIAIGKIIMIGLLALFGNSLSNIKDHPYVFIISLGIMGVTYYLSNAYNKRSGIKDVSDKDSN
jgi:uncharacterized membrane protein YdjX (TVP38/TMEM64 family)